MKSTIASTISFTSFVIAIIVLFSSCFTIDHYNYKMQQYEQKLQQYEEYHNNVEALLDSLEENFNWQDRYDSEVIDKYYDSRRNLKH